MKIKGFFMYVYIYIYIYIYIHTHIDIHVHIDIDIDICSYLPTGTLEVFRNHSRSAVLSKVIF